MISGDAKNGTQIERRTCLCEAVMVIMPGDEVEEKGVEETRLLSRTARQGRTAEVVEAA